MDFYRIFEGVTYMEICLKEDGDEIECVSTRCMPEKMIHPRATFRFVMNYLTQWAKEKNDEFGNDIFTWYKRETEFDPNRGGRVRFVSNLQTVYCRFERCIPEEYETEEKKS